MSMYMDFTCPEALSPESNREEAPMLEDKSGAEGNDASGGDELLKSENAGSDCLESQRVAKLPAAKPDVVAGAGLENLGNTCFLNSVMQCFIHTVPLLHGVLSDKHLNCDKEGFCIIRSLRELINLSLTCKWGTVAPRRLVDNMSYFSSGFKRFQQEDAHEFLQCFLDKLESCHNSSPSDNIVKQVFGGCLVSKLKCCNCGHCSDTYEPTIDLSLEIGDTDNLLTSLQSFTKVENIEDPEIKFTCEDCKEQVSIQKQLAFDKIPSVAVFQLKRFKNDGCLVHKIEKHVAFPLELDLLPFTAGATKESDMELKYKLYAIVVHDGWTSTSGHYYCFICLSPNMWCKFDDSRVELVTEEYVLSQEAYLLFYAKEGTSSFSSFIETQTYFDAVPSTWKTSPKSVLDRMDTSPVNNSTHENKLRLDDIILKDSEVGKNNEIKSSVPSPKPHKDNSPTLPEKVNCTEKINMAKNGGLTPFRFPSPEIYREDPPDAGFSIPRNHLKMVGKIGCKRRLEKDMDDLQTRQACSYLKKSHTGSRAQQLLAALRGSKTEPAASRKKISPVIRRLVAENRSKVKEIR